MPVAVQCNNFALSGKKVTRLWRETATLRQYPDELVTVRCVDEQEIRRLNRQYRGKEETTNVLTFSYDGEHDIALCLAVAKREALGHDVSLRDYVAWLLVHAFLHVTGLDHERSTDEAVAARQAEVDILKVTSGVADLPAGGAGPPTGEAGLPTGKAGVL